MQLNTQVVQFWFDSLAISSCLAVNYQDIIHAHREKRRFFFLASLLLWVFHRIAGKFLRVSQKLRFPTLHFHGFVEVLIEVEITLVHDWSKKNILVYIQCIWSPENCWLIIKISFIWSLMYRSLIYKVINLWLEFSVILPHLV